MNRLHALRQKIKIFSKTDFGIALTIVLAWKLVISVIGFGIDMYFGGAPSFFDHTMHWDAGWYLTVLNGQYADNLASSAFYPVFPILVGFVRFLTFGFIDYPVAGQIVNTTAAWFAVAGLLKLGRMLIGEKQKFWLIALILCAPTAFFLHVFYSEAVFMALSVWAYYFALKRNWLGVGILLAFLTATRLPSVLIIALCGLEFLRAYDWKPKKFFNKKALYFLLAPLGFIAYAIYLSFAQSDPLGMVHAYQHTTDWSYHVLNPNIIETIAKACYQIIRTIIGLRVFNTELFVNVILPLWGLFILGLSSIYLLGKKRRQFIPLGVVGILSIIMFTLNSNVVSVHRYVLPSITIYVAIALFIQALKKPYLLYILCAIGVPIQLVLYSAFIRVLFAG